jgi:hypothetical protein
MFRPQPIRWGFFMRQKMNILARRLPTILPVMVLQYLDFSMAPWASVQGQSSKSLQ